MNGVVPRRVYLLDPKRYSPEIIAVAFAKTSRSPLSFDVIADELTETQSAEFHDKWVVGYGHASVAEHAVLHVAMENVSRLAIECIESNRLASYTEKSTRYQKWDLQSYFTPPEVMGSEMEALYHETCDRLFQAYQESLEPVRKLIQDQHPRRENESAERWDGRLRSRYVDVCRFLLPSAAVANVGMTANARTLEHAIRKMLSHPLQEVRDIGAQLREVAQGEIPTLLKYADRVAYMVGIEEMLAQIAAGIDSETEPAAVRLIDADPEAEKRVLAAAIFSQGGSSFAAVKAYVDGLDEAALETLAERFLGGLDRFDIPPRALEHAVFTFEAVMDQGAYFEFKRHRMMTQSPQVLRGDLGYAVPKLIVESGFEGSYRKAMEQARQAYQRIAEWNPHVAAYLVPNGFNRRVLMTLNLRQLYHFCELRSATNAHFSIRRVALQMAELVKEIHPHLARFMRIPGDMDWRAIDADYFAQL
ncbi:MAG: FAD-dependent thymidylate synthase [Anaerolineales bacterium]|nr:MAG: FAD-dependent thymidylate synthase [Anaerolineales bacterium]